MRQYLQRIRSKIRHNSPKVLYNKWTVVRSIEKMQPIPVGSSDKELHVLVCARDLYSLLWSLRSFYDVSSIRPGLYVHADPTLKEKHFRILEQCFPGLVIVRSGEADAIVRSRLTDFPACAKLRESHVLNRKIFDFFCFGSASYLLFCDADILFYEDPVEITNRSDGMNAFIEDHWTNYVLTTEELRKRTSYEVPERINIGFGAITRDAFDLPFLEKLISDIPELATAPYLFDQTTVMLMACRKGVVPVGGRYRMNLNRKNTDCILQHYTIAIRERLYTEGIPYLYRMYKNRLAHND